MRCACGANRHSGIACGLAGTGLLALVLALWRVPAPPPATLTCPGDAPGPLRDYAEAAGIPLVDPPAEAADRPTAATLEEIRLAARAIGIDLRHGRGTLEGLLEVPGPVIVRERAPDGLAVYLLRNADRVQRLANGVFETPTYAEVERLYAGEVLYAPPSSDRRAICSVPTFHRDLESTTGAGVLDVVFPVANPGRRPLQVSLLDSSCNCVMTRLPSRIGAGGAESVAVAVRPMGVGTALHRLTFQTTDPAWPRVTLTVALTVPVGVSVYPERLYVNVLGPGAAARTTLTAAAGTALVDAIATADWLGVTAEPLTKGAVAEWLITLDVDANVPVGETATSVLLHTSPPNHILRVPVVTRRFSRPAAAPRPATPEAEVGPADPDLRVMLTTDILGELEPCGCVPGQPGGLTALATVLDRLRNRAAASLLVDAGGLFERPGQASLVADVLPRLGYDLVCVSPRPPALEEAWSALLKDWGVPRVGEGVAATATVRTRFGPVRVTWLDPQGDPGAEAERALALMAREASTHMPLTVLVSRRTPLDNVRLARYLQRAPVPVILMGDGRSEALPEPITLGAVTVASLGARTTSVTCVDLARRAAGGWRVVGVRREPVAAGTPPRADVARAVEAALGRAKAEVRYGATVPLGARPSTCGECHVAALAAWREMPHARAVQTLRSRDRLIADCLECHSAAYRRGGRLPSAGLEAEDGVTCAVCHGDLEGHAQAPERVEAPSLRSRAHCVGCHQEPRRTPHFELERALAAIRHW